jgi:hypothetical protein
MGTRGLAALIVSVIALVAMAAGTSDATTVSGPITKTFSFIGKPGAGPVNVINKVDTLTVSARCNAQGFPVIFAFTSSKRADIFGRMFDGFGRGHIIKNSAFTDTS